MALDQTPIVLKFGGTSVGSPERIQNVARIVKNHREIYAHVAVVVSAMGDTTDDLISLAERVSPQAKAPAHKREMDMLLSAGERISMSLLSIALVDLGIGAVSLTGSQSGIITDTVHGEARISEIKPIRIPEIFAHGKVAIVAGFQGISQKKEITTLGRGGSDTSAVALACVLGASEARIFTDVDGVFSADPRTVKQAQLLREVAWDTVIDAAYNGAQVLHPRCVELARAHNIKIRVLNSFSDNLHGTAQIARANGDFSGDVYGTVVFGENDMSKSLEGPKTKMVSHSGPYVWIEKSFSEPNKLTDFVESLRARSIFLNDFEIGAQDKLQALMLLKDSDQLSKEKIPGLNVSAGPFYSLKVHGVGLSSALELARDLQKLAQDQGAEVLRLQTKPQSIELWLKAKELQPALLESFHNRAILQSI